MGTEGTRVTVQELAELLARADEQDGRSDWSWGDVAEYVLEQLDQRRRPDRDPLDALYGVATGRGEGALLDELSVRAGLIWQCTPGCHILNDAQRASVRCARSPAPTRHAGDRIWSSSPRPSGLLSRPSSSAPPARRADSRATAAAPNVRLTSALTCFVPRITAAHAEAHDSPQERRRASNAHQLQLAAKSSKLDRE